MVIRSKPLYEFVAKKNNLPIDLIESVGNCVFEELRTKVDEVNCLAYELPKFGVFQIRFNRFEQFFKFFNGKVASGDEKYMQLKKDNMPRYLRYQSILEQIEEYRKAKKIRRAIRHGKSEDKS